MINDNLIKKLSNAQRNLLIQHIDSMVPVERTIGPLRMTFVSLMRLELITGKGPSIRPRHTVLTMLGREVVATLLSEYAEALIRAGYLDADRRSDNAPLLMLERLKKIHMADPITPPLSTDQVLRSGAG